MSTGEVRGKFTMGEDSLATAVDAANSAVVSSANRIDGSADDLAAVWLRLPGHELAQAVALLRRTCRLSRDSLAQRLCGVSAEVVGVDAATIWRWEAGRQTPRVGYRRLLGRVTEQELGRMDLETRREFLRELTGLAGWTLLPRVAGILPHL